MTTSAPTISRPYAVSATRSFLGFGIIAPLRRDQKGDFAAGAEAELVMTCVRQVLGTECSTPTAEGELPWRPEFGSRLHTLRHRNLDDPVTLQLARVYTTDALESWEPRFRVRGVTLMKRKSNPLQNDTDSLWLHVLGDVIRANAPGNQVVVAGARVDVEVG